MHDHVWLVCLAPLSMVVVSALNRFRPPGCRVTLRDRMLVGLTVWAFCGVWIGANVVFAAKFAPEVTFLDRLARGLTVVAIGLAPLLVVKLVAWGLHAGQRSKKPRRAPVR